MLAQYIAAAVERATCEFLPEDQIYYCEVPDLPGVWSSGSSRESALEDLRTVVADWVSLGLKMQHRLPAGIAGSRFYTASHWSWRYPMR